MGFNFNPFFEFAETRLGELGYILGMAKTTSEVLAEPVFEDIVCTKLRVTLVQTRQEYRVILSSHH